MASTVSIRRDALPIEQASSIGRLLVLIVIWAAVGNDFKLYMDISVRGLIVSTLFTGTSILVVVGFRTRLAMLALAASMLVHGLAFDSRSSLAGAILAAATAALPIGSYYSLDRLLRLGVARVPTPPTYLDTRRPRPFAIPMYLALAAFILGGPIYNQVLNHDSKYFLMWDMYHTIGTNLVNAHFFTTTSAGDRSEIDYLTVLGHKTRVAEIKRIRDRQLAEDTRIVGAPQLESVIWRLCGRVADPATLRVEATIASVTEGWLTLYTGNEPVCSTHREQA